MTCRLIPLGDLQKVDGPFDTVCVGFPLLKGEVEI